MAKILSRNRSLCDIVTVVILLQHILCKHSLFSDHLHANVSSILSAVNILKTSSFLFCYCHICLSYIFIIIRSYLIELVYLEYIFCLISVGSRFVCSIAIHFPLFTACLMSCCFQLLLILLIVSRGYLFISKKNNMILKPAILGMLSNWLRVTRSLNQGNPKRINKIQVNFEVRAGNDYQNTAVT